MWRPHGGRDAPDLRARDARSFTARSLTLAYVAALLGIAALVSLTGWIVHSTLQRQDAHAGLINRAGFQRALSERAFNLAAEATGLHGTDREGAWVRLRRTADALAASNEVLTARARAEPGPAGAALRRLYFAPPPSGTGSVPPLPLDAAVRAYAAEAALLADSLRDAAGFDDPDGAGTMRAWAAVFRAGFPALRVRLNDAVSAHEAAARADARRAKELHLIAIGAALLLLLVEAILIFRPMARRAAALAGELEREARTDPLTGLMNRRALGAQLEARMAGGAPVAVIAVDLDHFKEANDTEGHEAGDAILRAVAERMCAGLRPGDVAGRLGGDEFVALLPGVASVDDAASVAERLRGRLHEPVVFKGRRLRLGASLGVALAPRHAEAPDALLRAADEALLRAKREGRGRVGRADAACGARASRAAAVSRALAAIFDADRAAPGASGLCAHLQPVVALAASATPPSMVDVRGFEALARWRHAELGQVAPDEFFPLAERSGLAHVVSRAVRADALAAFAQLRRCGLVGPSSRLAVNLSAAELQRADAVAFLEEQVEAAGLGLSLVSIEITEDAVLERVAHATLDRLAALRGRGARIALDDFGTGTSGLAQLLRVPLDAIKIDRSFARNLGGAEGRAERVVEGIVKLAHSLGLRVVAEGIETEAQAAAMRGFGCDLGQGFLWSAALAPGGELEAWLRKVGTGAAAEGAAPAATQAQGAKVVPLLRATSTG